MYAPILLTCSKFISRSSCYMQICVISTTRCQNLIQAYRKKKGLPMNPNAYGPLTDLPDYSYLDGRPAPLGMRLKRRMAKQREIAEKIITLSKEVDSAVQRHEVKIKTEKERRETILSNKMQPKGHLLLKDKNWNDE